MSIKEVYPDNTLKSKFVKTPMKYKEISRQEMLDKYFWIPDDVRYSDFFYSRSPSLEVAKEIVKDWNGLSEERDVLEIRIRKGGANTRLVYVVGLGRLEAKESQPEALYYMGAIPENNSNPSVSTLDLKDLIRVRIPFAIE